MHTGCSLMEDMLPLDTFQLSGIPDWRSSLTSTSAEVCHLGEIKDSTEGRFCAVLLRSVEMTMVLFVS